MRTDGAGKMSFLDHLDELRRRLVASAISLAVGAGVAFAFIDRIFDFIMRPLADKLPAGVDADGTSSRPKPFML